MDDVPGVIDGRYFVRHELDQVEDRHDDQNRRGGEESRHLIVKEGRLPARHEEHANRVFLRDGRDRVVDAGAKLRVPGLSAQELLNRFGASALTLIRSAASSTAAVRVSPTTACLLAP